jgi:hypothetical protein
VRAQGEIATVAIDPLKVEVLRCAMEPPSKSASPSPPQTLCKGTRPAFREERLQAGNYTKACVLRWSLRSQTTVLAVFQGRTYLTKVNDYILQTSRSTFDAVHGALGQAVKDRLVGTVMARNTSTSPRCRSPGCSRRRHRQDGPVPHPSID